MMISIYDQWQWGQLPALVDRCYVPPVWLSFKSSDGSSMWRHCKAHNPRPIYSFWTPPVSASHTFFGCNIFDLLFNWYSRTWLWVSIEPIKILILTSPMMGTLPFMNLENYRLQFWGWVFLSQLYIWVKKKETKAGLWT